MNRTDIRDVLRNKIPLLFDGATGTELYNKGIFINKCFEEANLYNTHMVAELHNDYVKAGAEVLESNTWGANRFKLAKHNLQDKTYEINKAGASIARQAAGAEAYVAGSVGPLGVRIEPWGPTSFDEAIQAFTEQMQGLIDGGIDIFSLQTFSDISELQQAIKAARNVSKDTPIFAQVSINLDGNLPLGTPLKWAIQKMDEWGVDVIGLNCSIGPQPMFSRIATIKGLTTKPIVMQPNAGLPKEVEGRTIYMCTPEYMGEFTKNFLQEGVQFVGGCCGTSPEHVKAMAKAFRHYRSTMHIEQPLTRIYATPTEEKKPDVAKVPFREKSMWSQKIADGESVFSVELLPPAGVDFTDILAKSKALKQAGVDAINIPDGPRAGARMSAILTSVIIEQQAGIETVLHYTCRDRNLLGMQSDMLGAQAIGLRNMLLITGDPPKMGSYPDATGVFDIDAIGLVNMVRQLNSGVDLGGRPIGKPTSMSIGVGVNPVHQNFEYEMKRFCYKVEAGAEWAITQPVFDVAALYKFIDYIEKHNVRIPIIAGIWPLLSFRNAQFMNNEVPGVVIPKEIMAQMAEPQTPEEARQTGVRIARKMSEELKGVVQGIQVSAPFGRIDLALQVAGRN
ncbi:MAG: bifunctional homocysteine S-methyltransferase/methylenetetrahydrofolate reductase [Oligoflexales bacterium]